LGELLIWNDIISFNSIENQRKQCFQLHGIGFESELRIWIRKSLIKCSNWNHLGIKWIILSNGIQFVWKRTIDVKWYSSTFLFGLQIENLSGIHSISIQLGIKGDISMNWFPILGIIDKLFKLKSIGNQKKHRYGTQSNLKSNLCGMIFTNSFIGNWINWFVFKNMNMNDW
jgi:hypothetical protein